MYMKVDMMMMDVQRFAGNENSESREKLTNMAATKETDKQKNKKNTYMDGELIVFNTYYDANKKHGEQVPKVAGEPRIERKTSTRTTWSSSQGWRCTPNKKKNRHMDPHNTLPRLSVNHEREKKNRHRKHVKKR